MRKERRELKKRWRKGRSRTLPSASALFRYLENFHDAGQEKYRQEGKAFIPKANDYLKALGRINKELLGFESSREDTATLDMDATLSATWKKVKDELVPAGRQWAEVCFVPDKIGPSKKGPEYRYLATREELKQTELPGMEKRDDEYLFPVMKIQEQRYKVFGIVTNMDWAGAVLIPWLYQRCGKSEEAQAAMKSDFAGGKFPSGDFGENAAWWLIMVLSHNLNVLMKRLALGGSWITKRMKAVRFGFINIAGRVIDHARRLLVRISGKHPSGPERFRE